jgi:hypothetical protein
LIEARVHLGSKILMSAGIGAATLAAIEVSGLRTTIELWLHPTRFDVEQQGVVIMSPGPTEIIDELHDPQRVKGWNAKGLQLEDGRVVAMPDGVVLPEKSQLLEAATREGVEIDSAGRIFGLLRIWHWCGNDPTRNHIARIDIARLMEFVEQSNAKKSYWRGCDTVAEDGWDVDAFYGFEQWLDERSPSAK